MHAPIRVATNGGETVTIAPAELQALARELRGVIVTAEHPQYDAMRAVWNGLVDKRPALMVRAASADDVVAAVRLARRHDLALAVRGGGHNVAGRALVDDGLVIDMSLMRGVEVDPARRLVRAQGGATLGDVDRQTLAHALAAPLGLVTATGVAGFTLHGGYGWQTRPIGLAIDALESVEIVTADGQRRTASEMEEADLFWAVRGGGGNFGAVTSFTFRLSPLRPTVWFSVTFFPLAEAAMVLGRMRDYMATAPDELGALASLWTSASEPPVPVPARAQPVVAVLACWFGPMAQAERVVAPLRRAGTPLFEIAGPTHFLDVQQFFDADYPNGRLYYWKSSYLRALPDDAIALLVDAARRRPSPLTSIDIWPLGGMAARVPVDATAFPHRRAPVLCAIEANWDDPAETQANIDWARELYRRLDPLAEGAYLNFPGFVEEGEELVRRAYGPNYARLRAVKTQFDPDNLFHGNFNIRPSTAPTPEPVAPAPVGV